VRHLLDKYMSGIYGFVPHARIRSEIKSNCVFVVEVGGEIIAAAIGRRGGTLWNIVVDPRFRHAHIGSLLVRELAPERIRVKCRPHETIGKSDLEQFTDPTPFYERLGYVFEKWDYPRNVYAGKPRGALKPQFIVKGEKRTVKIMRKLGPKEKAPEPDLTARPRILGPNPRAGELRPRVRS